MRKLLLPVYFFSLYVGAAPCNVGTYNATDGTDDVTPCLPCEVGRYTAFTGSTSCTNCPVGTFQDQTGQVSCENCEAGTFTGNLGSISCDNCPSGMTSDVGASTCTIIPTSGEGGCGAIIPTAGNDKPIDFLLLVAGVFSVLCPFVYLYRRRYV